MRSLAHDLGQALGCGGHLKTLERLQCGGFSVSDAVSIDEMEERFANGDWRDATHAPDVAVMGLRAVIVGKRGEDMIRNGRAVEGAAGESPPIDGERGRAYSVDGCFLATLAYDGERRRWCPEKVFALNYSA